MHITTICLIPQLKLPKTICLITFPPPTLSNYTPLLHNKHNKKQIQTQQTTNTIHKHFSFIFMSLILLCKSFSLNFNSSTSFIKATMIFFWRLLPTGSCHWKKLHPFLPVSYMPNITNNNQQLTHKSIPTKFIFFHMHQINIPYLV